MSITCSLFGHKFGDEESEERREEQNGKTAIVEVSTKECIRCGISREEKMRTRIVDNGDSEEEEQNSQQRGDEQESRTRSSGESSSTTGFTSEKNDYIDDEADGGVILKDNTDNNRKSNRPDRSSTGFDTEPSFPDGDEESSRRMAEDDRGVVVMGNAQSDEDETTEHRIVCESCTFSEVEVETSRRNGDLCPSCGGWLEVREIKGTEPEETQEE